MSSRPGGIPFALLLPVLAAAAPAAEREPSPLALEAALPIESAFDLEPSGLALAAGRLLFVSDKHDDLVFELVPRERDALAVPTLRFAPPPGGAAGKLDLEGIAAAPDGRLYLASEGAARVLVVDPLRATALWLTPDLRPLAAQAGLLARDNAGLEGLALAGPGRLYLAAEREPRGILELTVGVGGVSGRATACEHTWLERRPGRALDFADLHRDGEALWALERNLEAICRLDAASGQFTEAACWSFAAAVARPDLAYADATFGMAEGLSLDADHVYVVLDNNREPRAADRGDCRPLLLVFTRPPAMR